ncbi:unnamed protein product [Mycena citricolor]|uniref:Uncharacterized protein n=1 Tax=Mycena citricolor TaxID=2018698 RepID=A0AAD2H3S9_9AGAR|nr:unnamed protein product [Mycena citricolor]
MESYCRVNTAARAAPTAPSPKLLSPFQMQVHTVRLVALFVNAILYGILVTTFDPCLNSFAWISRRERPHRRIGRRKEIKLPILLASISMFLIATFSTALSLRNVLDAFISWISPGRAGRWSSIGAMTSAARRIECWQWRTRLRSHGVMRCLYVADSSEPSRLILFLQIYRCYVLYDRNFRKVLVPFISYLTLVVATALSTYLEISLPPTRP